MWQSPTIGMSVANRDLGRAFFGVSRRAFSVSSVILIFTRWQLMSFGGRSSGDFPLRFFTSQATTALLSILSFIAHKFPRGCAHVLDKATDNAPNHKGLSA